MRKVENHWLRQCFKCYKESDISLKLIVIEGLLDIKMIKAALNGFKINVGRIVQRLF